jgi:predicted adenine nucleotide alpha hydrolase (AANH) superfamily ATPase
MQKEKILIHCCCAPCSTYSVEKIKKEYDPVLYFYNPNIEPIEEYNKRLAEIKRYAEIIDTELIIGEYDNNEWFDFVKEFSDAPEGGNRCKKCFNFNLNATAKKAKELSIKFFTTTLTISSYKNSNMIFKIGNDIADEEIHFISENFKKKDGYKKSVELSKKYKLYRQNYCGCRFSLEEKNVRKSTINS